MCGWVGGGSNLQRFDNRYNPHTFQPYLMRGRDFYSVVDFPTNKQPDNQTTKLDKDQFVRYIFTANNP